MNTTGKFTSVQLDAVTLESRKEGVFAGLTSALASALIGSKFLRFTRTQTLVCGVLTGILSGYYFTEAFTASNMAKLERAHLVAEKSAAAVSTEAGRPTP
ncbi:hypothetical protein C8J56DRAFT_946502 [Mycena floridula]|nr:hypothetical protein C8J56DRAFT_946502 [Mycena floridula]